MNLNWIKPFVMSGISSFPGNYKVEIPYVCKFQDHKETDLYLSTGKIESLDWDKGRASDLEAYLEMVENGCGPACLLSILKSQGFDIDLYDVYTGLVEENAFDEDLGLGYSKALKYLNGFGLEGEILNRLNMKMIKYFASRSKYVVLSVSKEIGMHGYPDTRERGGHLVLLTGYSKTHVRIHNSSGSYRYNMQENYKVRIEVFKKYFAGRGFVVASN